MSAEFEYAIKKDVRNNPIVREVDRERHVGCRVGGSRCGTGHVHLWLQGRE